MGNISHNEESAIFDRSFDTLASEIETHVLKALTVVTMSRLKSRFRQLVIEEGNAVSNYKSLYVQSMCRKTFIWLSNDNSSQIQM
jgi:hypothetical protein